MKVYFAVVIFIIILLPITAKEAELTLKDFGYEEKWNKFSLHESIIAKDTSNLSQNETESMLYFMFECKYPLMINLHLNNLLNDHNRIGFSMKIVETGLPNNIKVYAINNKRKYILASQERVLDISKVHDDMSEDEFLDIVYKKIFLND